MRHFSDSNSIAVSSPSLCIVSNLVTQGRRTQTEHLANPMTITAKGVEGKLKITANGERKLAQRLLAHSVFKNNISQQEPTLNTPQQDGHSKRLTEDDTD